MGGILDLGLKFSFKDHVSKPLKRVHGLLSNTEGILGQFNQEALSFDSSFRTIGATLNQTNREIVNSENNMLKLANSTGISVDQLKDMNQGLANVGVQFAGVAGSEEDFNKASMGTAKRYADMVLLFGKSGVELGKMASATAFTGVSMKELGDDAVKFQQQYKIPGVMEETSAAVEFANEMLDEFGDGVLGNGKTITRSILKTGALFAKTFNVTMNEAVQEVQANMRAFAGELSTMEDLTLGLSDDFGGLATALLENAPGISSMEELQDMLKMGAESPEKFAEQIRAMADELGGLQGRRLIKAVSAEVPQMTKALLQNKLAAAGMTAEQKAAAETLKQGLVPYDKFIEKLKSTADMAKIVFGNLLNLSKVAVGKVWAKVFGEALKDSSMSMEKLNKKVAKWMEKLEDDNSWFNKTFIPTFKSVFTTVMEFSGAIAIVTGAFASLVGVWVASNIGALIIKPFKFFFKILGKIGGAIGKVAGGFFKLVKGGGLIQQVLARLPGVFSKITTKIPGIGLLVGAIMGVYVAATKMWSVFSDPELTGVEKIKGVLGALGSGLLTFVDSMLLGIPGLILSFFPKVKETLSGGLSLVGDFLASKLMEIGIRVKDHLMTYFTLGKWIAESFKSSLVSFKSDAQLFGEQISAFLAPIVERIGNIFTTAIDFWKDKIFGVFSSLKSGISSVGKWLGFGGEEVTKKVAARATNAGKATPMSAMKPGATSAVSTSARANGAEILQRSGRVAASANGGTGLQRVQVDIRADRSVVVDTIKQRNARLAVATQYGNR